MGVNSRLTFGTKRAYLHRYGQNLVFVLFSKFLSLLYFSAVCFARPVVQLICKSDSCLLKWICNVVKFYTLHFVVLMRFVAGQSGNRSYALLTQPPTAHPWLAHSSLLTSLITQQANTL